MTKNPMLPTITHLPIHALYGEDFAREINALHTRRLRHEAARRALVVSLYAGACIALGVGLGCLIRFQ